MEGVTDMPMVPLSWLSDHVDVPEGTDAEALAAALVKVGLEEEEIHPARVTGPLVVGRVLTRVEETASNGKIVNYCRVDVGEHNDAPGTGKEPSDLPSRGIICGAHNFDVDDLVVVSLPGAILPGDFQIAARKTYGHVSDGMICSARELGLGRTTTALSCCRSTSRTARFLPLVRTLSPGWGWVKRSSRSM